MYRVGDNPPTRYPERSIEDAPSPWWVLKLLSRMEKATACDCMQAGVEYFMPMYTNTVRRHDNNKLRKSLLPLFPGYLPVSTADPYQLLRTGRIAFVIPVVCQDRFRRQLAQVYHAWHVGANIEPCAVTALSGQVVKVGTGPCRGLVGVVEQVYNGSLLVLPVEAMGQVAVRIDASMVKYTGQTGPCKSCWPSPTRMLPPSALKTGRVSLTL
jgi:hypothetical protein